MSDAPHPAGAQSPLNTDSDAITAYCAQFGIAPDRPEPGARDARLGQIVRAHLARVPYENVSKWLAIGRGAPSSFDLRRFVGDLTTFGLGGTCLSLAVACHHLLRGLGYDAALVTGPAGDHAAVLVEAADGSPRLVDVGFFAPFWEPIPLDRPTTWPGALGGFTVTPGGDEVVLRRPSGTTRTLTLRPTSPADIWQHWVGSCAPGHPLFPRAVVVQRLTTDTAWSLFDCSLHTITAAGLEERQLTHDEARASVREIFDLDPDTWEEALAVRERLLAA